MADRGFTGWRKSSRSLGGNDNCVEMAVRRDGSAVGVRDSKEAEGRVLVFPARVWMRFLGAVGSMR